MESDSNGDLGESRESFESTSNEENTEEMTSEQLLSYPDQVIIFLELNTNDQLCQKLPQLKDSPNLLSILNRLRTEGTPRYERYVNVGAFAQFLSVFDREINSITYDHINCSNENPTVIEAPKREKKKGNPSAIDVKINDLYYRLEESGYGQGPGKLKMSLNRENFLRDAFDILMNKSKRDLQRKKLFITFKGEEGLDYSGPSREFFHLASGQLFNPYYCWFEYTSSQSLKKINFFRLILLKFSGIFLYFLALFCILLIFLECSRKLKKLKKQRKIQKNSGKC